VSVSSPLTHPENRRAILERRRHSLTWGIIHFLGSVKMAVILLGTIALACAVATFAESGFNAKVAQYYIYKSPWFIGWLGILCLNLFCVTLTRWPWQRQHHGFVLTHYGIITLLFGAVLGRLTGFEAFMTIDEGQPPQTRVIIQESTLQMQVPASGHVYSINLPVEAAPPSPRHPRLLEIPETPWKIRIDDYTEHLQEKEILQTVTPSMSDEAADDGPGVALAFHSNMMQQDLDQVVLRDSPTDQKRDLFGRATIEWAEGPFKIPPPSSPAWKESQMLFARHPLDTIITSDGKKSGWQIRLADDPTNRSFQVTATSPNGHQTASWPLAEVIAQPMLLPGNGLQIKALGFWPDFAMQNGVPVTLTDQPVNAALLLQVSPTDPTNGPTKPTLRLFTNATGGVDFQLLRGWQPYRQGTLHSGEPLTLGWADWQLTLVGYAPHARKGIRYEKPAESLAGRPPMEGQPGIHAALVDEKGTSGPPVWIISGNTQQLTLGPVSVPAGFGLRTRPLPFQVTLEKFEVPRYEGTDNPANYISTLRFDDLATGLSRTDTASMNKPATFPGGFWRSALGRNYKFSQASWNPQNLQETTLQILYDPGWPWKWLGSLMVVVGIFMLFYLKPSTAKLAHAP
jgi:hypothetical protein